MSDTDVVYWVGFISGTVFGNTIGMLFTVWWLRRNPLDPPGGGASPSA